MKIYYKATKLDGTDFYTGTVDYAAHLESGKPLKRLTFDYYECCTSTVYHASSTPSETLIGCSWPCRLFEVTGRPVAQEGNKFGFRSMRVVREIPAWQALGPNGEKVAALIERAGTLTSDEATRLAAARDVAWFAAWDAARDAARDVARDAAGYAARNAARDAAGYAARNAARDAAGYAAWMLVIEDLVGTGNFTQEHFDLLYGPWREVIGE